MTPAARGMLLGDDWMSVTLLAASTGAVLWLLHRLAAVALGDDDRRQIVRAIIAMALVVLLMSAALHRSRSRVLRARQCDEPADVSARHRRHAETK
jgi:hypothetical protein